VLTGSPRGDILDLLALDSLALSLTGFRWQTIADLGCPVDVPGDSLLNFGHFRFGSLDAIISSFLDPSYAFAYRLDVGFALAV